MIKLHNNGVKYTMPTIQSPKFSASTKTQLLANKMSPASFRNKRIPSALDHYPTEINNCKNDSPSKFSEDNKRRKSQHGQNNPNSSNNPFFKKSKEKETREIIDSINCLKQEYKALKDAYKELIQEKLKSTEQLKRIKGENGRLKIEADTVVKQNQKMKIQIQFLNGQIDRIKRECYKMIELQKFKIKKLQEALTEKQQYINQSLLKIRTEGNDYCAPENCHLFHHSYKENNRGEEESLTISQDKSILAEKDKSLINQSQFLSFSLTSVLQQSTYKEPVAKKKKEHTKVLSELTHGTDDQMKITEVKSTKNKDANFNFKKFRKEITPKLDFNNDLRESKPNLVLNNLGNFLNSRTPMGIQKKTSKSKPIKSFRKKQDEKENSHISQLKNGKKKSKKLINLSSNE